MKVGEKCEYISDKRMVRNYAEIFGFDMTELSLEEQIKEIEEKKKEPGLICDQCGKRFYNADCLKRHKHRHVVKPNSFVCDLCSWVFKKKSALKTHLLSHRYIFCCQLCKFQTKRNENLYKHHIFHQGKQYPCKYCDKVLHKQSSLLGHIRLQHASELPWCDLCGEAFISDKGVINHKKLTHDFLDHYPCICECSTKFRSEAALDRHLILNGCDLPGCAHCGEAFPSDQMLKHHLIQRHIDGGVPNTFDCESCIFRFYNHAALMRHACGAFASCAQCGDNFESTQQLVDHITLRHDIFKCEECSRQFSNKTFKNHYMSRHSGLSDRPRHVPRRAGVRGRPAASGRKREDDPRTLGIRKWRVVDGEVIKKVEPQPQRAGDATMAQICEVCGKGFPSLSLLSRHSASHAAACPHRCERCGKRFKCKAVLVDHMRVHTGERPYQCSECPKAFKSRGAYTRHYLVHTGQRNHVCTMCDKAFQTSSIIKLHIQTVHMKMPWPARKRRKKRNDLVIKE